MQSQDQEIWTYALSKGFAIVTKDSDFEAISLVKAPPGKVILVALGNCTTASVASLLRMEQARIKFFLENSQETILVLP
jgi:predicted nuclease of predicted toxin-antitoxin system